MREDLQKIPYGWGTAVEWGARAGLWGVRHTHPQAAQLSPWLLTHTSNNLWTSHRSRRTNP